MEHLKDIVINQVLVQDIRFPTSKNADGSDAMHTDPDYSCAYVTIRTNHPEVLGHGLTFTIGRGNEIVARTIESLAESVILGLNLDNVFTDFAGIYRRLTSDTQFRWLGPEKGVIHLASAALLNTLWDLWAKYERKPLWQLLCDLPPTRLVGCIDFRYICDALTPDEALSILESSLPFRSQRIEHLREYGLPAYTTSAGWLGYDDQKIRSRCRSALAEGWHCFKMMLVPQVLMMTSVVPQLFAKRLERIVS